jgi:hypothetical protein
VGGGVVGRVAGPPVPVAVAEEEEEEEKREQ